MVRSFEKVFEVGLAEDCCEADITSQSIFKRDDNAKATFVAKEPLTICGLPFLEHFATSLSTKNLSFKAAAAEGDEVKASEPIATLSGNLIELLSRERTLLNLLQHLSGIATLTKTFVQQLKGSRTQLLDTRKTLPGYRLLQKYAVRVGGAKNHRMNLGDMVLVKDNHIHMAGGVQPALERVRSAMGGEVMVEVECKSIAELNKLDFEMVDRVMLDNMDDATIAEAIKTIRGRAEVEVSGSVNLERLASLRLLDIDAISTGTITHSAKAVDISMAIEPIKG